MPDREGPSEREGAARQGGSAKAADAVPANAHGATNAAAASILDGGGSGPLLVEALTRAGVSNRVVAGLASGDTEPAAVTADGAITPPVPGVNKTGFIDHSDGANLRDGPSETGGRTVHPQPLPPATQVFVSGTYPKAPEWSYVTAMLDGALLRGYVQGFRITTDLPEPTAKLYQIREGDNAEGLAVQEFSTAIQDGHDLRYYENVLLYVNRERRRAGIVGQYQDPGVFGGGANNIQLVAGHRIWLVSPAYAMALKDVVPSGSLTGGAVAKVKRFGGHLQDILASVTDSPRYFAVVAGEYAQAIRDHLPEIIGIVALFVTAEVGSMLLAASPTGVGQIVALVIQLGLAAFGAAGLATAGVAALKHASNWLTLAWEANGDEAMLAEASKEFLRMLVAIAMAALAYLGVRTNVGNAVKIANSMTPPMPPAFAVAGSGRTGVGAGTEAGTAAALGPPTPFGPVGNAVAMTSEEEGGRAGGSGGGGSLTGDLTAEQVATIRRLPGGEEWYNSLATFSPARRAAAIEEAKAALDAMRRGQPVEYIGRTVPRRSGKGTLTEVDVETVDEIIQVKGGDYSKATKLSGDDLTQFNNTRIYNEQMRVGPDGVKLPPKKLVYYFTHQPNEALVKWCEGKGIEVRVQAP